MSNVEFHGKNHYLPCLYLKNFEDKDKKVQTYRTIVPTHKTPEWKAFPFKGIAYYMHLYTYVTAQGETDEIERWLDKEFESPAEPVIQKVISGDQLSPNEWSCLIRFAAAQDVRTPARLLEGRRGGAKTYLSLFRIL